MEEFYKKKIIREFLSLFSESKWKKLCILCMEYGILQLKRNYNISSLSLDDIDQFVDEMIEEDKKKQKANLRKFDLSKKSDTSHLNTQITNNRPNSNWRKGESRSIFDIDDNDIISTQKQNSHTMNTTTNEEQRNSKTSKVTREKLLDQILYPKQKQIGRNNKDDYVFGNNKQMKQKNYQTNYQNDYGVKLVKKKDNQQKRKVNRSNSNSNMKFNSGLQMLRMRAPSKEKYKDTRSMSKNKSKYDVGRYRNVMSKIKSQIETDKKIYEMLKQKAQEKKSFEDRESSIAYQKSEMSFEDDFSSFV